MPRRRKGAQHAGGVSAAFGEPSSGPAGSAACQDRQESGTGFDETRKLMNSAANGRGGNSHARSVPGAACDGNEKEVRKWARGSGEACCCGALPRNVRSGCGTRRALPETRRPPENCRMQEGSASFGPVALCLSSERKVDAVCRSGKRVARRRFLDSLLREPMLDGQLYGNDADMFLQN